MGGVLSPPIPLREAGDVWAGFWGEQLVWLPSLPQWLADGRVMTHDKTTWPTGFQWTRRVMILWQTRAAGIKMHVRPCVVSVAGRAAGVKWGA